MRTFSEQILHFLHSLEPPKNLPEGVEVLNPYRNQEVLAIIEQFYTRFYSDANQRVFIWGINPGRFGGGLTGLPFIDPPMLETRYGIKNAFQKKPELSAGFVHQVIDAFGGEQAFYSKFYINSINPLGLVRQGKNFNFYDSVEVYKTLKPFIVNSIQAQLKFGANRKIAICLGTGKLQSFTQKLNDEYGFFQEILAVEHPRFIMQYRRKKVNEFVEKYLQAFEKALP